MNPTSNRCLLSLRALLVAAAALGLSPAQATPAPALQDTGAVALPAPAAASGAAAMPRRLRYGAGYESRFGWQAAGPPATPGSGAGPPAGPSFPRGHGRGRRP